MASTLVAASLCLLLAAQLQLAAPQTPRRRGWDHGRILGGSEASVGDFPWQLALLHAGASCCGASVIGAQWALTAAYCVNPHGTPQEARLFSLLAGSSNRSSGGTLLPVARYYEHELHDVQSRDYDIALLWVEESFPLGSNVAVVNLPEAGYEPPVGLAATVSGWGQTETERYSDTLHKLDVTVAERSACHFRDLRRPLTARTLCAGRADEIVCYGDSGSPLVSGRTQLGIASWGSGWCARRGAAFVSVGSLRSWITEVAGI